MSSSEMEDELILTPPCLSSSSEESESENEVIENYDTLVLSGGATKGLLLLGAVQCAIDNGLLENVNTYLGTSIGAITCYLLAIGYTPIEIMVFICVNRIVEKMQSFNLIAIINNEGVSSYRDIQETLEKATIDKIGKFLTLKELHDTYGKKLICVTYNESTNLTEYVSVDNNPDLPCFIALRMSSNVPFLFNRFKYDGSYYIDGGIVDNFPIVKGDNIGKKVLGIYLQKPLQTYSHPDKLGPLEYIFKLLYIPIKQSTNFRCSLVSDKCTIVSIMDTDMKMFNFNIPSRTKLEMFSDGYQSFKKKIIGE